jgi:tetratricopeptide (TPR) repeat protein
VGILFLLIQLSHATVQPVAPARVDEAVRLQHEGKNLEALRALRALLPALRATGDHPLLVRALVAATDAGLAVGEYQDALLEADEAFALHKQLGQNVDAAWDLNAAGLANLYLGRYDLALERYERALALDRASADGDGEITRLNNIGNVHFMHGRYADSLRMYQDALHGLDRTTPQSHERLRKMTISNLAALDQRLGADERALDWYAQLASAGTMPAGEEAQLLVNQGALCRRLGDPVKALDLYRSAQQLFARAGHRDGEIGAWRNIGIVYALDLIDYDRALHAFDTGLALARASANRRGEAQARLYRGEALRRMGRQAEADRDLHAALDAAVAAGLVEEQWKARYGIGLVRQTRGDFGGAREAFERAIATIESVRSDLQTPALRSEFLADRRDVYDALIWLRAHEQPVMIADLFTLVEQSRSRAWQDRVQASAAPLSLSAVQARVPHDTLLLEYWNGHAGTLVLWISHDTAGVATRDANAEDAAAIQALADATSRQGSIWRPASARVGEMLLGALPLRSDIHSLLIVPDGPLHVVPFETLTVPASADLVVERFDVAYLPSAAFLLRARTSSPSAWTWPWRREVVAFAAPASATSPLETRSLPALRYATEEVQRIARELGGADLHVGADARKALATDGRLRSVPVVHFATHAIADTRDPDRSRILLAPAVAGAPADYLFLREIYDLDLTHVELVTLSACDTERGKIVRGEGAEGFSRALLAAGASSAVTTMWDIGDRTGAEFMTQFYFQLASGRSKGDGLRQAKLAFLHSGLAWAHPYYWAGYVLSGDARDRLSRVVPASLMAAVVLASFLVVSGAATARRSMRLRRTQDQRRQSAPTP